MLLLYMISEGLKNRRLPVYFYRRTATVDCYPLVSICYLETLTPILVNYRTNEQLVRSFLDALPQWVAVFELSYILHAARSVSSEALGDPVLKLTFVNKLR